MKRKTVLHIATRFLDGGSEGRLTDVIRALPGDEFEHRLLLGIDHDLDKIRERLGECRITIEPHLRREIGPRDDLLALMGMTRFIRRGRFDVVHTCQSKAGILGRLAAKLAGTPVVLHSLSMANFFDDGLSSLSPVFRNAERLVGLWTDAYIVVGGDLKRRYIESKIGSADRYHIVRTSIDVKRFQEASRLERREAHCMLGLPPDESLVCHVGSLQARKGVLELPAYLRALRAASPRPVRLLIAGEGELESQLRAAFAAQGLSGAVTFLGFTREVATVMAASDCVVLLSQAEGMPQVLVQAAGVRRPFVSYPVDGALELISLGATGTITSARDPTAAARATVPYLGADNAAAAVDLTEWETEYVYEAYRRLFFELARQPS